MIKNIVFDFGDVLVNFDLYHIMRCFGVKPEDEELILRRVFRTSAWTALDRGVLKHEEAERIMCSKLPERLHETVHNIIYYWWRETVIPMPGMAELIKELKANGYKIYLLSNATVQQAEYFSVIPGSEYFDGRITSGELLLLKPERAIYEALFKTYELKPEECFFVDDLPGNIEAGERCGMSGAVFFDRNVAYLREDMRAAGINVAP